MILHVIDARNVGGIETHVVTAILALREAGIDAEALFFTDHGDTPAKRRFAKAGIRLHFGDGTFFGLLRAFHRLSPRLVHTHGYKAGIAGRAAAVLAGIPVVSTFHAGERATFPVRFYQIVDDWTSFLATRLAVSEPVARRLPFGATIMPNFVHLPERRPRPPKRNFVFVGRMSEEKGPDLFCRLARCRSADGEWHAHGDGPMLAALRAQFGDVVAFHGHSDNIGPVLDDAALVVMPSRAEGLPMAALEAMAHGAPVLAASVGGLPDLIEDGHNGFLFPAGRLDIAGERLDRFLRLEETERRSMAEAARQTIEDRYSPEAVVPLLLDQYRSASARSIRIKVQSSAG